MAQNSRRGRSGRRRQGGGNNPNRSIDSQGPEVKIRGNAQQVYDKYTALARDAFSSGDRIRGESLQQHAEHYYRMLQAMQPKDRPQDQQQTGQQDQASPKAEQAERDGQARHQNKDHGEGPTAARATDEPARMDGAAQAASDDAQGTPAPEADTAAEDAPKRRRRRRTRRDEAEGEGAASDAGSEAASEKAPRAKKASDASAEKTERAEKAPEEAPA